MLEGLYSAAAGMAAQQTRLDAVSNDLANESTPGYKPARVAFRDLVYQPAGIGALNAGVLTGAGAAAAIAGRTFEQGALQDTGRPADVAISGEGFIEVRRADGSRALTRDGALQVDAQGRLTTGGGELVQPPITLPKGTGASDMKIAPDGTVTAAGKAIGRLSLVTVRAPQGLQPVGDSLFLPTAASGAPAAAPRATTLVQGSLEASSVDVGTAMVDMIDAERSFQLASRAITVQDQILEIANGVKR
jgi:flagellar basal-body rod protein FlgG